MTRTTPTPATPDASSRPDWMHQGLCTSAPDPDLWFPEVGQSARPAIAVCARCPVAGACLGYALSLSANPAGVWGGTTEEERRKLRRNRAAARRRAQRTKSSPQPRKERAA
jgi:WhiB family redox-sensing transcriptional regulator